MNEPTRDELIDLCMRGSVPQDRWHDRDSARAQRQLGECLALLAAGCDFTVSPVDGCTWWVQIKSQGFNYFEFGSDEGIFDSDHFYVPTAKQLADTEGRDWY